jgi:hypothetical protein
MRESLTRLQTGSHQVLCSSLVLTRLRSRTDALTDGLPLPSFSLPSFLQDKTGRSGTLPHMINGALLLSVFFGARLVYGTFLVRFLSVTSGSGEQG